MNGVRPSSLISNNTTLKMGVTGKAPLYHTGCHCLRIFCPIAL
jgi:hypothetical protein